MTEITLTESQQITYEFIKRFVREHRYSPTTAEITEGLGLKSRSAVHRKLQALEKAGLISLLEKRRRNILLQKMPEEDLLPLVGNIAAGQPIELIAETVQERIDINQLLASPNRFLLKVKGDSMIGDNICDGDLIVCEHSSTIKMRGQIAVVVIRNLETTLKRVLQDGDKVLLIPSNPNSPTLEYKAKEVQIQGIYLGLLRLQNLKS